MRLHIIANDKMTMKPLQIIVLLQKKSAGEVETNAGSDGLIY